MAPPLLIGILILSTFLDIATGIQIETRRNSSVYSAQLRRRAKYNILSKRADAITASLLNSVFQGLYFINVTVGTPPTRLSLQIDTGSSDTWVPSSSAPLCQDPDELGCPDGSFSASQSNSFNLVGPNQFNISYVDHTGASGDYFQDYLGIEDIKLSNFEMGLARTTTIGTGIMGIGYNNSEANTNLRNGGNGTIYQNIPYALVSQGLTKSPAYSLWLNDLQSSTGSILFSGVDTAKYTGELISVNVYPTSRSRGITSFTIALTSLSATSSSGTDQLTPPDYAVPAILDSGTTITFLPDNIAMLIFEELGATPEDELGLVLVPCALAENSGFISYGFGGLGGPIVKVAVSDLILPLEDSQGRSPTYKNGLKACQLGVEPAGSLPVLLGDTFLRSAYVVYDLANNRVGLSQTKFNTTDSNIVPFSEYGAPIPNAKAASNEIIVTQTLSDIPKLVSTARPSGTDVVDIQPIPSPTQLSARAGFTNYSPKENGSHKNSFANTRPEPLGFTWTVIFSTSFALMSVITAFAM